MKKNQQHRVDVFHKERSIRRHDINSNASHPLLTAYTIDTNILINESTFSINSYN